MQQPSTMAATQSAAPKGTPVQRALVGSVKSDLATVTAALVGVITAQGAQIRQAAALIVGGTTVAMSQGGALAMVARGDLAVKQGGGQFLLARGNMEVAQGGGQILACGGGIGLTQGGGQILACGGSMEVTQGGGLVMAAVGGMTCIQGGGGIMVAPRIEARGLSVGVLVAGKVEGAVTPVLGTPQALAFGAAAGAVGALVLHLLSARRQANGQSDSRGRGWRVLPH